MIKGFQKFFLIAPFKEIKKSIAPSNKTAQKLSFKTTKTFFRVLYDVHLQLKNI